MQPRWVQTPTTISHCGFCTRAESGCGSGRDSHVGLLGGGDFLGRAVADEHRLAAPFDRDDLAFRNGADIDFGRSQGQRRGVGAHLADERPHDRGGPYGGDSPCGDIEKISAGRFDRRCGGQVFVPNWFSANGALRRRRLASPTAGEGVDVARDALEFSGGAQRQNVEPASSGRRPVKRAQRQSFGEACSDKRALFGIVLRPCP